MFADDQADSNNGLCIDLKSSHRPKTQAKNSKKTTADGKVANNAVEVLNVMPVQTSQIPCQPVHKQHTSRSQHTSNMCFSSHLIHSKVRHHRKSCGLLVCLPASTNLPFYTHVLEKALVAASISQRNIDVDQVTWL